MYFNKKEMKFINKTVENGANVDQTENGMKSENIDDDLNLVGTAEYVSPEMIKRKIDNAHSMDLWALGIILYKFFHGKTPFKAANDTLVIENIKSEKYTINEVISLFN